MSLTFPGKEIELSQWPISSYVKIFKIYFASWLVKVIIIIKMSQDTEILQF